ncbi:leukocyte cell derived chemotaxin 2, tandem duplicate 1 [Neoarius graeffei]|uniref:leukocyte cell derived chemotaxin 2, tandem duplicate 1 n=1 Tax=Neoarius graeffei TaxID=443677 RepID=UPI00298CD7C3|nr:leukocyte cell derived chemotaxin 2, tandem duplicate 1 [Neoarius graeffei]
MMKLSVFLICAVLCVLQTATAQVKFGQLCSGNAANTKRGCDTTYGCGNYGASRNGGKSKHSGLDIVCADGATVYAPFDVTITRKAVPYTHNNAINNGLQLSGGGLCFKLFYLKPDKYSGSVKKGQKLGTLLPMQTVYPGITSHIHVQLCDKSNPTKYF